ncbi:acyl carrier protein [Niveispirillum sp.]|uniref:acyl carrier protein n=1 Tax=Niveispirillum sp. TaxID=1917217 RepID=UPI001B57C8E6|nr:acyl carrier protein [Niveispirillum sp.]MBP7336902.1 acyl carrier protein [Niveispirillum sp.]
MSTTFDRICADPLILDILGAPDSKPSPDAKLLEDFHLDSLDMVELAMALEEQFQIDIPDDDWEDAADMTLAQVAELVDRRQDARGAA